MKRLADTIALNRRPMQDILMAPRGADAPRDWRDDAACRDHDPELFFPEGTARPALRQAEQAKRICQSCPVRTLCLRFALQHGLGFGIWGGAADEERRFMRHTVADPGVEASQPWTSTKDSSLQRPRQDAAKVKARFRPWRSTFVLGLAAVTSVVSWSARTAAASPAFGATFFHALGRGGTRLAADAAAVAFCLLALLGTTEIAGKAREALRLKIGNPHAAVVRYAIVLTGGLAAILIMLQLFGISVTQLLLGGAFATVLLGIAGQQSLSGTFAGLVLLLARPVDIGDRVWVRSGPMGGELRGTVTEINLLYVRLDTPDGLVNLPNQQVLAAAVGLAADDDANQDKSPDHPAETRAEAACTPPPAGPAASTKSSTLSRLPADHSTAGAPSAMPSGAPVARPAAPTAGNP